MPGMHGLFQNNEKKKRLQFLNHLFRETIEGRLYYMGKLMQSMDKGYNAEQYFKAAYKNR
jgi:hypothetical protein